MTGRWEVYCSHARAISLDKLASKLSRQEHRREGDKLIVVAREQPAGRSATCRSTPAFPNPPIGTTSSSTR